MSLTGTKICDSLWVAPGWITLGIAILLGAAYFQLLCHASRKSRNLIRTLAISAGIIFLVNAVADGYVITQIAEETTNAFSVLVLAVAHSLELFVFQTHFFDNGYQEFFFGHYLENNSGHPGLAFTFAVTFVFACITSAFLIIRAFSRRRAGRNWLAVHKENPANTHIFFLGGEAAITLAQDVAVKCPDDLQIFVGFPDPEESYIDLSIWEKIKRLFRTRVEDTGPFDAVIYSRIPLSETTDIDICKQMGLKDLDAFLKSAACKVYLLSDDEEENLRCAERLHKSGCNAEIFCRACREGLNQMYEEALSTTPNMNVHLVDSSYLAVRNIKSRDELLPVHYVDKGTDAEGRLEGWVSSPFNAMILGFGEAGREALGFLYEYGAFVDRDFQRSPFSCVVMDRQMDTSAQAYRKSFPGMNENAGIVYESCVIGSDSFWAQMHERIHHLNYIVIALGDDRLNLKIAAELVEFAFRQGKDLSKNFLILVAQSSPTHLDDITLNFYNSIEQYHDCIRTFGTLRDVWTFDNMTNANLQTRAKQYFAGYMRAKGEGGDPEELWKNRENTIQKADTFALHAKSVRQRSQDYANCLHIATKLALCSPDILDNKGEIVSQIPPEYIDNHYTGSDKHVEKVLRYLAVHEHIRWEASHVALGYTPGKETDEVKKTHLCIKRYDDLTAKEQHFDYLVVKTTLML